MPHSSTTNLPSPEWDNRPITVLGLSRSGISVADYVLRHGGQVFLSDVLPATPTNAAQRESLEALGCLLEMGGHSKQVYTHAPQVVISPGILPSNPVVNQLKVSGLEVISEVELAYRENKSRGEQKAKWIGITGTNGKTTTTTLLANTLQSAGKNAPACGNIGYPVMTCLNDRRENYLPPEALVVELSSFQLAFSPTLTADIAVFLNLTPDHLNWHGSIEAYTRAKLRLFTGKQSPQWAILNADDPLSETIIQHTQAHVFVFSRNPATSPVFQQQKNRISVQANGMIVLEIESQPPVDLFPVQKLHVLGEHNQDNVMAAIAAAHLSGVSKEQIIDSCLAFKGVEHRLERVEGPIEGPSFYNDSKATNTDAAISALQAFGDRKVIIIAGGRGKNEPLERFVKAVQSHAQAVVLIGEEKERFAEAFKQGGFTSFYPADNLEEAVKKAITLSQGEPILFSPACASFDHYKNFEERGEAFKRFVYNIKSNADKIHTHQT